MKRIIVLLCCVFVFFGLYNQTTYAVKEDFFYWMDGYVAVPVESVSSIMFTYCFPKEKSQIDFKEIESISFQSNTPNIMVQSFRLSPVTDAVGGYQCCRFTLDVSFPIEGLFKSEFLAIHFKNGSNVVYPIGTWWFDVGVKEQFPDLLDTSMSDTFSECSENMTFQYKTLDRTVSIRQFFYGNGRVILSMVGMSPVGSIELDYSYAPIKYVKTKVQVETSGKYSWIYGKGCYCGNMNLTKEGISASLKYTNEKIEYKKITIPRKV